MEPDRWASHLYSQASSSWKQIIARSLRFSISPPPPLSLHFGCTGIQDFVQQLSACLYLTVFKLNEGLFSSSVLMFKNMPALINSLHAPEPCPDPWTALSQKTFKMKLKEINRNRSSERLRTTLKSRSDCGLHHSRRGKTQDEAYSPRLLCQRRSEGSLCRFHAKQKQSGKQCVELTLYIGEIKWSTWSRQNKWSGAEVIKAFVTIMEYTAVWQNGRFATAVAVWHRVTK